MVSKYKVNSEILTVMFVDIVDYTNATSVLSRKGIDTLHSIFDTIVTPVINDYNGVIIKKIGDAFMATFKSSTDAVLCGVDLQNSFINYNKDKMLKTPLKIRVVMHTGEVIVRGGDVYGDAVNIASRIEGIAHPDHIVFTESVYSSMNRNEVSFVYIGVRKFAGIRQPIKLFRVKTRNEMFLDREHKKVNARRVGVRNIWFFVFRMLLLLVFVALIVYVVVQFFG